MSLYRVHLTWKGKDVMLRARELDMTHPYFVSIRDLVFPEGNSVIIDPSQDEVRRTFGHAEHLLIPFQSVSLIEEVREDDAGADGKVRPFTVVEGDDEPEGKSDGNEDGDEE
jgi:hypothetical protein